MHSVVKRSNAPALLHSGTAIAPAVLLALLPSTVAPVGSSTAETRARRATVQQRSHTLRFPIDFEFIWT